MVKPIHEFNLGQLNQMSYEYDENGNVAKRTTATLETTDIEIGAVEIKDGSTDQRATVDSNGALKVTGGASSVSAQFISPSDFNATQTSSTTITLTGVPFTAESAQLVYIKVIPSSGDTAIYVNGSEGVSLTISSNVVTISGVTTPFTTGDTYEIGINGQDKAYDADLDVEKSIEQAPIYAHETSVEHIVDLVDTAAATYRKEFTADNYNHLTLHLKGSGGITFTMWATLDDTTDETADTGWVDVSSEVLGVASLIDSEDIYFIDTAMRPLKWMVKYVASDATNAVDVWIKKFY